MSGALGTVGKTGTIGTVWVEPYFQQVCTVHNSGRRMELAGVYSFFTLSSELEKPAGPANRYTADAGNLSRLWRQALTGSSAGATSVVQSLTPAGGELSFSGLHQLWFAKTSRW